MFLTLGYLISFLKSTDTSPYTSCPISAFVTAVEGIGDSPSSRVLSIYSALRLWIAKSE